MYAFLLLLILMLTYTVWHYRTLQVSIQPLSQSKSVAARGVLALLIVLHHYSTEMGLPPTQLLYPVGAMAVGVFFFMSGYGLSYSYAHKGDDYLRHFLPKRFSKIILPFALAISAWQVEEVCLYGSENLPDRWALMVQGLTRGCLPFSWYVWVALYYYMAFYLIFRFIRSLRLRCVAMLTSWGVQVALVKYGFGWDDYWYYSSHLFIIGMIYQHAERKLLRVNAYVWMALTLMIALLVRVDWHFSEIFFDTAFALLFICGITLVDVRSKVLDFLGKISYEIYLVQGMSLFALKDTAFAIGTKAILMLSINIALAYLLHVVVGRVGRKIAFFRQ